MHNYFDRPIDITAEKREIRNLFTFGFCWRMDYNLSKKQSYGSATD